MSGIVAIFVSMVAPSMSQPARADCVLDLDWPEKPCLDTPPYQESYLREEWQKYYELKGDRWMEMKKAEMDGAIENGTLKEWTEYQSEPNNFTNFNVYYYYFLNGQAPDLNYYSSGVMWDTSVPAPEGNGSAMMLQAVAVLGIAAGGAAAVIFYYIRRG